MLNAPCQNCQKRSVGCHSTCSDYKNYITENEKIKSEQNKDYEIRAFVNSQRKTERESANSIYVLI